jgi:class 3 adenylate cyclase
MGLSISTQAQSGDELLQEAREYRAGNNIKEALRSYVKAERRFEAYDETSKTTELEMEVGLFFDSLGVHDKAREYFFDAYSKTTIPEIKSKILTYIAASFFQSGGEYIKKSIEYYLQALPIIKQENNTNKEIKTLSEIAAAYSHPEIYQLDTAFQYRKNILDLETQRNSPKGISIAFNNLAYTNRLIATREINKKNRGVAADTLKSALKYIDKAIQKNKDDKDIQENRLITLLNLGIIEQSLGNDAEALKHLEEVLKERKNQKNQLEVARTQNIIAKLHFYQQRYPEARIIANQALQNAKAIGDRPEQRTSYEILADIHEKIADFRRLSKYKDSIYLVKNDLIINKTKQQQTQNEYKEITSSEIEKELTKEKEKEKDARLIAETERQKAEIASQAAQISAQRAKQAEAEAKALNAGILQQKAEADKRTAEAEAEKQKALVTTQKALLATQEAEKEKAEADKLRAEADKRTAEADKENAEAKADAIKKDADGAKKTFLLLSVIGFFGLVIIFILIFYYKNRQKNRLLAAQNDKIQQQNQNLEVQKNEIEKQRDNLLEMNEEIKQQNEEIETQRDTIELEKEESEKLLLNILPQEVAYELKEKGQATPKSYEMVSVLFTDFKGFTIATEHMNPTEVIRELDKCFGVFDQICEKYGLEKIKTIGDAYMCAGGIPIENTTNYIDAVRAGLEIQAFMKELRSERESRGEPYWELRLGINTGPLVAGVVGTKKFAYDIWGDTVNTASRMESSGVPNKVNISGATYELVKDHFVCEYRGKLPAKSKGEIDMYFVLSEK